MKEIDLIPGEKGEKDTAFCRQKMNAAGVTSGTLTQELMHRLAPFAALLGDTKGFAVILRGDEASLVGIDDNQSERSEAS